jgi:hypothetical protein
MNDGFLGKRADLNFDCDRHAIDVSTNVRSDWSERSLQRHLRDARLAEQRFVDFQFATPVLLRFTCTVCTGDRRLVGEMRRSHHSFVENYYLGALRANERHVGSIRRIRNDGLSVGFSCGAEHFGLGKITTS